MDDFVRGVLTEWGFTDLIEKFRDQEIDKESLLCLEDSDVELLIPKAGPRAKFRKRLGQLIKNQQDCGQDAFQTEQDIPGTSGAACENVQNITKRKDPHAEVDSPAKIRRQCDTEPGSFMDNLILSEVKSLMMGVHDTLSNHENTKLNAFLRKKIWDLSVDKRDLVGVFGKTGAGKSSLINAIIEERGLLPTGTLQACTTVMIKVEANTQSKKYEAEIEFISKEEWEDEVWSLKNLFGEFLDERNDEELPDETDDEEYNDIVEKMTALYGNDWKDPKLTPDKLMEAKYFKEIPEFLQSRRKIVQVETAQELSGKVLKYTRSNSSDGKRWLWPLVKCVTVRVPDNDHLKHITLVDLPGNGDRNKSRDQMWKKIVADCSTVWVVAEMNRAAADRDAWEILENTCNLMGNGGECQKIYFICTKCDEGGDNDGQTNSILNRNRRAKDLVMKEFKKLKKIKKHFKEDCFQVFTVSSKEFFKLKKLGRTETEIPDLQNVLKDLNDQHDQTLNYVQGAYGILSLIKVAKLGHLDHVQTTQVFEKLNEILQGALQKVKMSMDSVFAEFEMCLSEGVAESKSNCEVALKKALNPKIKGRGRSFHRPLRCALQNNGVHKTKKKQINLNEKISSHLTDSIDEEFRKTFPNDAKSGPLYEVIDKFSLETNELTEQYKTFELQLTFIKTEVSQVKTKLHRDIRDRKKIIYSSLTKTVEETMQECYMKAAEFRGPGSLEMMKCTVEMHLRDVKDTMFDRAKDAMLAKLKALMAHVQEKLRDTLQESIELSLKSDHHLIPDFERQFNMVKKHLDDLTRS